MLPYFKNILISESYETLNPFKIQHYEYKITYKENTLFFSDIIHKNIWFKYKKENDNLVIFSETFFYLFVKDEPCILYGTLPPNLAASDDVINDDSDNTRNYASFCDLENNYLVYSTNNSIFLLNLETMHIAILPIGIKNYTIEEINGMSLDFVGLKLPYLVLKDNVNCYVYNIVQEIIVTNKFKFDTYLSFIRDYNSFHIQYNHNNSYYLKTFSNKNIRIKTDYILLFYANIFKIIQKENIKYLIDEDTDTCITIENFLFDIKLNNLYFLCGTNYIITDNFELHKLDIEYNYVCKMNDKYLLLANSTIYLMDSSFEIKKITDCCNKCVKIYYIED